MTETLYDQAMTMYQRQDYVKLLAFKKLKKKSWAALGINAEMEARIMNNAATIANPFKVEGTVTGRLPAQVNENFPSPTGRSPMLPPKFWRLDRDMPKLLKYKPRDIHVVMAETSHGTLAQIFQIAIQEKFRADPRFPLYQMVQRAKRYKEIFTGRPYLPIFA